MAIDFDGSGEIDLNIAPRAATPVSVLIALRPLYTGVLAPALLLDNLGPNSKQILVLANGVQMQVSTAVPGTSSSSAVRSIGSGWQYVMLTQDSSGNETFRLAVGDVTSRSGVTNNWSTFTRAVVGAGYKGAVAEMHFLNRVFSDAEYAAWVGGALAETIDPTAYVDGATFKDFVADGHYPSINGTFTTIATPGGIVQSVHAHPFTRAAPGPTISAHPSNQTVTTPATATFSVTAAASGGGTLSYQWQRSINAGSSWSNVATGTGGTTSSYTTAATTVSGGNANNADQWRCVVTETGGTNPGAANSGAATLTVNAAPSGPTINTQPSSQSVTALSVATFTVAATASAGALSYQWQRSTNSGGSWANVSTGTGGTTNSYTTPATSVSGGSANSADQYRCAVTDSNGTTNSNAATLTVGAAAAGLTSSPLKTIAGVLHLSAPFEAFVINSTTGALVLRKTGLTSHASTGVVTFTDAALSAGTQYRVVWRRTDTGAHGVELLTAA